MYYYTSHGYQSVACGALSIEMNRLHYHNHRWVNIKVKIVGLLVGPLIGTVSKSMRRLPEHLEEGRSIVLEGIVVCLH